MACIYLLHDDHTDHGVASYIATGKPPPGSRNQWVKRFQGSCFTFVKGCSVPGYFMHFVTCGQCLKRHTLWWSFLHLLADIRTMHTRRLNKQPEFHESTNNDYDAIPHRFEHMSCKPICMVSPYIHIDIRRCSIYIYMHICMHYIKGDYVHVYN